MNLLLSIRFGAVELLEIDGMFHGIRYTGDFSQEQVEEAWQRLTDAGHVVAIADYR